MLLQPATVQNIKISGILEICENGILTLQAGKNEAIVVEKTGILLFNGGDAPIFENDQVRVVVKSGGMIRIDYSLARLSQNLAGNESAGRFYYEDAAIFHWNTEQAFTTRDQTYFPNACDTIIPIFRVGKNQPWVGANAPTTINGLFEATGNVNWQYAGNKIFRNGITGSGHITQSSHTGQFQCGPFFITGQLAILSGPGSLNLNHKGLTVAANTCLTGDKTFYGGPLILTGTLDALDHTLELKGDLIIETGGLFKGQGSTLLFSGNQSQQIKGSQQLQAWNITVTNPMGIFVPGNLAVNNLLTMAGGNIYNEGYILEVGNESKNPGVLQHLSGTVTGAMKRHFAERKTDSLFFPIGSASSHNPAALVFEGTPAAGSITARFITEIPDDYYGNLPFMADGVFLNNLSGKGFWQLDASDQSSLGTFCIYLDARSFPGIIDPELVRILSRMAGEKNWQLEGYYNGYPGNHIFSQAGIKKLSQFSLASDTQFNPLPIQLLSLAAYRVTGEVAVQWSTASEINNDFFTVERSSDTFISETLAMVKGAGFSNQLIHYQVIDRSPLPGLSYYRLKQTDFNGNFSYSKWIAVKTPDPVNALAALANCQLGNCRLIITGNSNLPLQIMISDLNGKSLLEKNLPPSYNASVMIPPDFSAHHILLYRVSNGKEIITGKVLNY